MNTLKSNFDVILVTDSYVLIEDNANKTQTMSVTNDAENVVEFLIENNILKDQKLFYVDTDGRVDQLVYENGEFKNFKAGFNSYEKFMRNYFDNY